jgi:hypothetical protein
MKVVAAYLNSEQAFLAAARLESAGIAVDVRDSNTVAMNWLWAPAIGGVKVAVADEDFGDAVRLLNAPSEHTGILKCPHCGSSDGDVRTLSPVAAILLAVHIPVPFELQKVHCRSCRSSYAISAHPHWGASRRLHSPAAETPPAR